MSQQTVTCEAENDGRAEDRHEVNSVDIFQDECELFEGDRYDPFTESTEFERHDWALIGPGGGEGSGIPIETWLRKKNI